MTLQIGRGSLVYRFMKIISSLFIFALAMLLSLVFFTGAFAAGENCTSSATDTLCQSHTLFEHAPDNAPAAPELTDECLSKSGERGEQLAGRGCCSKHGGVCGCAPNGRTVCCDNTLSPSCRC